MLHNSFVTNYILRQLSQSIARSRSGLASAASENLVGLQQVKNCFEVHKFGGSSVGNAEGIKNVASILQTRAKSSCNSVVGVTSAVYGVTNVLMEATKTRDMKKVEEIRHELVDLHRSIASELVSCQTRVDEILDYNEEVLSKYFDTSIKALNDEELSEAERLHYVDCVASLGERLSTKLLSVHMNEKYENGKFFEADKNMIITDEVSGDAVPNLSLTRESVRSTIMPSSSPGSVTCVTGYLASSLEGKLTTLGRGGSDLTAAVLGHALDADEVTLWKVESKRKEEGRRWMSNWEPGFVGVVHDADFGTTVPNLGYEEAAALSRFGKAVLHPRTVAPAVEKRIPINVRNTMESDLEGTTIGPLSTKENKFSRCSVSTITSLPLVEFLGKEGNFIQVDCPAARQPEKWALVALVGPRLGVLAKQCKARAHRLLSVGRIHARQWEVKSTDRMVAAAVGATSAPPAAVCEHSLVLTVPIEQRKEAVALLHKHMVVAQDEEEPVTFNDLSEAAIA